jgi:hypothetical protein
MASARAVIRDGRWVSQDETPLDPVQLYQLKEQVSRIHAFAENVVELTHDKIEILTHILYATPEQEQAILKILAMDKDEVKSLIKATE